MPGLDEGNEEGHHRGTMQINIRPTTSVGVQGTGMTTNGSLPGLTVSMESAADESVASSIGYNQILHQHILSTDSSDANTLIADSQTWITYVLECPFKFLGCRLESQNARDWLRHSLSHFMVNGRTVTPPTSNKCCFCSERFESDDGNASWSSRMEHIKFHHEHGHRLAHARPDFDLMRYCWQQDLIDQRTYRDLLGGQNVERTERTENAPDDSSHSLTSPSHDQYSSEPVACLNERRRRRNR